ncbi:hypothetical protein GGR08_001007 [Bartonella fuyuanensis]|uniref:DUF721 domain-containing protein n=1 Tax=Bartonella fuyuanensis TaxID=1460968 RepID=A0A840DUI4_9HYPH|nr:DciA family protein [Bartonella fuyuanensis]MBB4076701.1 hypothetical protein [Bartonella fuyuanensis]
MRKKLKKHSFYSLSETIFKILDPVLRKRTGLNVELIEHWPQIVGGDISKHTIPLKIIWKHRRDQNEVFQPATLVVACEGFSALKLMHETEELLHRINGFFGYIAIDRIKIEQRNLSVFTKHLPLKSALSKQDKKYMGKMLGGIEDKNLRQSLYELGCCIFSEKNNK